MDLSFQSKTELFKPKYGAFLRKLGRRKQDKSARSALGKLSKEDLVGWQKRLAEKGWAATNWPTEYGGATLHQRKATFLMPSVPASFS